MPEIRLSWTTWWATRFVLLFPATLAGCGSHLESEVSGTVSLDEKPIGPGTVVFAPLAGNDNPAVGTIRPDGTYFLKSSRDRGLSAGPYRVSVTVYEDTGEAGGRVMTMPKLVTPQKYTAVETSGLQYEVKPGKNSVDIPLTSN